MSSGLDRVREVARRDKDARFTALLHHVDLDRLRAAYRAISPKAAPGVDGVTWGDYGQDLEANLRDLHARVHRGAYRASPSRRVYIPKADGRLRPLGIAALEDKIVQRAVVEVLNAIYEADFLGFSYGFRPGRSPHDALDALAVGIERKKVNWVLDADIRDFFTSLITSWLEKFLEHRIADRRVLRLIQQVAERRGHRGREVVGRARRGRRRGHRPRRCSPTSTCTTSSTCGPSSGGRRHARGDVIIVRFADDFVVGFEHRDDAERFLADLRERFAKFGLELHPDKTRLIEFGRFAARKRRQRGLGKPETFDFLGFTHICGKTRNGRFWLRRDHDLEADAGQAAARSRTELMRRRHSPSPSRAHGWQAWCEGTSPTTPCPATARR